jgi:endonuclease G, mitochondrial
MTDLSASADARSGAHELDSRAGYDPAFLGVDVPLPTLATNEPTVELRYLHYSLVFRPDRRLAAVTAVALDGARLIQVDRTDNWELDPRLAAELQAGPPVYAHNDLDRGHLVMRASATWGNTEEEAQQAEADTFYFTNAAPQNKLFNQGHELWLGLEDYLQEHADAFDRKLVVLAGPVLDPADPPYRDIQVPLRFWKVVAFVQDGALAATGYLLDQTPLVDDLGAAIEDTVPGQLPPLGPFRTFQVPIADIAMLAGLRLDQLVLADRLSTQPAEAPPAPGQPAGGWIELQTVDDIRL